MERIRSTMLSEAELMSSRKRFGLFSQPPPIALGDNSLYPSKTALKGEDGKPKSLPRNMLAGTNRSGLSRKDFIQAPSSLHVGDRYLDPQKVDRYYEKKFHTRASFHQIEFKPSSGPKDLMKSSYPYIEERPKSKKFPERDETGRVVTKQRNITSNPITKVDLQVFKAPPHIMDPFERKSEFESKEISTSKQKMLGDGIFRSGSHGNILFGSHKSVYGCDSKATELLKQKKMFVNQPPKVVHHETKFKLACRGHGDPIGKHPEFIVPEKVEKQVVKVKKAKSQKQQWCHVGNQSLSRPTPSISYSAFSLRKYK